MDKIDFYFNQLVQETDLDAIQDNAETAIRARNVDIGLVGVCEGLGLTPTANDRELTLGSGVAYDVQGRRINITADVTLDLTTSSAGVALPLPNVGEEYYVTISVAFDQDLNTEVTDGAGVQIFKNISDSSEIFIRQNGAAVKGSAGYTVPPSPEVMLGAVLITPGTTTISLVAIDTTDVPVMFQANNTTYDVRGRQFSDVGEQILDRIDEGDRTVTHNITTALADETGSSLIGHDPYEDWQNDPGLAVALRRDKTDTDLRISVENIVRDMADDSALTATTRPGAHRVGFNSDVTFPNGVSLVTAALNQNVYEGINRLALFIARRDSSSAQGAAVVGYFETGLWRDGTSFSGSPDSVADAIFRMRDDLAGNNGSLKIGTPASDTRPAESVGDRLVALEGSTTAASTFTNTSNWFNGTVIVGGTTTPQAAINAMHQQLGSDFAATLIGCQEVDTSGANGLNRPDESIQNRLFALQSAILSTSTDYSWNSQQNFRRGISLQPVDSPAVFTERFTLFGIWGSAPSTLLSISSVTGFFSQGLQAIANGQVALAVDIDMLIHQQNTRVANTTLKIVAIGNKAGGVITWTQVNASQVMTSRAGDSSAGAFTDEDFYGSAVVPGGPDLINQNFAVSAAGGGGTDSTTVPYAAGDIIVQPGAFNIANTNGVGVYNVTYSLSSI